MSEQPGGSVDVIYRSPTAPDLAILEHVTQDEAESYVRDNHRNLGFGKLHITQSGRQS